MYRWDNNVLIINYIYMGDISPHLAMFGINRIPEIVYSDHEFLKHCNKLLLTDVFDNYEKYGFNYLFDDLQKKYKHKNKDKIKLGCMFKSIMKMIKEKNRKKKWNEGSKKKKRRKR